MPKPKHEQMDYSGLEIVADEFTGTFNGTVTGGVAASGVTVAAGTDGLGAGTLQAALQALATRVQALEDAP